MSSTRKSIIISGIFSLALSVSVLAQSNFDLPQNIELKTRDDYVKYEGTIIDAAKWLELTDLDKEVEKRKRVNSFVMQWVTGTPTINIVVNRTTTRLAGKNAPLMVIYLASYARYCLETKVTNDAFSANKAAIQSMMKVYKKGIQIKKTKEMDKLIKLSDEGQLDQYIKENFE
ncbi:MAG: hypothetical protein C5B59_20220 [Bacteroidetes bacterium]|nr:MAG: hypothetical protein C5B59_20220 [Bacteroidota bacterium]